MITASDIPVDFTFLEDSNTTEKSSENTSSFSPLKNYLQDLHKIPLLRPAEEIKLARLYHSAGGSEALIARNKLIQANLRLVVSLAKKYSYSSLDPHRPATALGFPHELPPQTQTHNLVSPPRVA